MSRLPALSAGFCGQGEEFVDEESKEESFVAEYQNPPLLGEEALAHAKRMLIELLS